MTNEKITTVSCPLCSFKKPDVAIEITHPDGHIDTYGDLYKGRSKSEWKICNVCGFVHQNPRPSIEALNDFYRKSEYHNVEIPENKDKFIRFSRWYYSQKIKYIIEKTGIKKGKVFDLGCGFGGALKIFEEFGWEVCGIEPDKLQSRYAQEELNLEKVQQGIFDANFQLPEKVDVIFSNHVFEHIADLHNVVKGIKNILKPNGFVFTCIPTYYKNHTLIAKKWMNSAHYSIFTHKSLDQLMSQHQITPFTHTYLGWTFELDECWHLAKYTGQATDVKQHYEDAIEVDDYIKNKITARAISRFPVNLYRQFQFKVVYPIHCLFNRK